jgi:hypothetical protein
VGVPTPLTTGPASYFTHRGGGVRSCCSATDVVTLVFHDRGDCMSRAVVAVHARLGDDLGHRNSSARVEAPHLVDDAVRRLRAWSVYRAHDRLQRLDRLLPTTNCYRWPT